MEGHLNDQNNSFQSNPGLMPAGESASLYWISPDDIVEKFINEMGYKEWNAEKQSFTRQEGTVPLINEEGLKFLAVSLNLRTGKLFSMTYYNEEQVRLAAREYSIKMLCTMAENRKKWGIKRGYLRIISNDLSDCAHAAMLKSRDAKFLESITQTTKRIENFNGNETKNEGFFKSLAGRMKI